VYGSPNNRRWSDKLYRVRVRTFFTEANKHEKLSFGYTFKTEFYDKNEIIFCSLIQQKKSTMSCWKAEGKLDQNTIDIAQDTMNDIFGSKPNRKNLKLFF
jgi:hypothetical protein